jgi:hypothetical protein
MVDGRLFDTLAAIADELRKKNDKPFGGIQVCCIDTPDYSIVSAPIFFS